VSAAAAADVHIGLHAGAVAEIEARFGEAAYPQRIRMAELPVGADLIPNPYNRIPGFSINRHFFLPGFPDMAHPMARWVLDTYYPQGGLVERQRSVRVLGITESGLTDLMEALVATYPDAKFFSLPRLGAEFQIELGFRGSGDLVPAFSALCAGLKARGARFEELSD
jgi:molybdopterin-biosynthesis enzyme MoeA-like protein